MLFVVATRDSTLREYNRNERKRNLLNTRKQYTSYNSIISDSFVFEFLVLLGISQYLRCYNKVNKFTLFFHPRVLLKIHLLVLKITSYLRMFHPYDIPFTAYILIKYLIMLSNTFLSLEFWNKIFTQSKLGTFIFL